jgi:hypothetical protein
MQLNSIKPFNGLSTANFSIHLNQRDSPALLGVPASYNCDAGNLSSLGEIEKSDRD